MHDIVSSPDTSFIVMELVEGETLQSLLARQGRLGLDETARILGQVAAALDHAHANGVVHRDVKPANIMIEPAGQVKVMDFGIAKLDEGANLTSTGSFMGTPNYMAPEQARGESVDARSDLFSLGCVLYECLTGTRPFQSPSVSAILVKILTEDPPPVDPEALGLPRALQPVLLRATAKDPSARYPSGKAMTNEFWVGDYHEAPILYEPRTDSFRTIHLCAAIDHYPKLVPHGQWYPNERTLEDAFKKVARHIFDVLCPAALYGRERCFWNDQIGRFTRMLTAASWIVRD